MSSDTLSLLSLAEELETIIKSAVPKAKTVSKYGGTLFTLKPDEKEGQFCGVFVLKAHVQLSFSKGAQIADPKKILSGTGKQRRHVNFTSMDSVKSTELNNLLVKASKL